MSDMERRFTPRPRKARGEWKQYRRTNIAEMRSYVGGESLFGISISVHDIRQNDSPKLGDMVARNPRDHDDQWLVAAEYFADNFEEVEQSDE